jgi:hypothetical protein
VPPPTNPRDPWRKAPVGELQEQLLPRWFVVLCVALVPVAVIAAIAAFVVFDGDPVPVAERRPPPTDELTHDVGEYSVGTSEPVVYEEACQRLEGVRIAGSEADQQALRLGLSGLCNTSLPPVIEDHLTRFAQEGGIVRFAQFQSTGVDSTALLAGDPPQILLNAKLQRSDPLWIAPVVVHDAILLAGAPETAEAALTARQAEDLVCDRVLGGRRESRGCDDAEELLALPDPLAALRSAGYR